MRGCFLNGGVASRELRTPKNVSSADNNSNLHALLGRLIGLFRNMRYSLHADATFTILAKTFPGKFQDDPRIFHAFFRCWLFHF